MHSLQTTRSAVVTSFLVVLSCLLSTMTLAQSEFFKHHPWPQLSKQTTSSFTSQHNRSAQLYTTDTHLDSATFTYYPANLTGVIVGNAQWIDYDNDGDLDIIVSGTDGAEAVTKIYRNDNGTLTDIHADITPIISERGLAWGDYDNDGDFDLAITGTLDSTGTIPVSKIYRNDNGTFVDINAPLMPLLGGVAKWVDYNLDGKLDLLIAGSADLGSTFYTKLYRNDDSTFTDSDIYFPGVWGASVDWADYDNDGDPDLLLTGYGTWGVTSGLFRNDQTTFTYIPLPFDPVNFSAVSWGDFDNDGKLDFVVSGDPPGWEGSNTYTALFHCTGNGTFELVPTNLPQLNGSAVAWGDYDNDGDLDLAINGWHDDFTNVTKIFRNDGNGVFTDIGADLPGTWWGSVAWGDVDNDGRLDLLVSGGTGPQPFRYFYIIGGHWDPLYPITAIYHNNSPNSNVKPSAPSSSVVSVHGNQLTFSWNGATDDRTPQNMLTYSLRVGRWQGASNIVSPSSNIATGYHRVPQVGNNNHKLSRSLQLPIGIYYWSVQSVDNTYAGSEFSGEQRFAVTPPDRWELVSLPYTYPDLHKSVLFPASLSNAFAYNGSTYVISDVLSNGVAYWLKFPYATPRTILSGGSLPTVAVALTEGWNMIGSVDHSIPVPTDAIIASKFYEYDGGYKIASTIEPGKGYWVKASSSGTIELGASSALAKSEPPELDQFNSLIVRDNLENSQTLYFGKNSSGGVSPERFELPPISPEGTFDARFSSNKMLEVVNEGESRTLRILVSSEAYPISLEWQQARAIQGSLTVGGKQFPLTEKGTVRVVDAHSAIRLQLSTLQVIPKEFSLTQNYPNPFNPSTIIRYALPEGSFVTLKVFNLLGQEITTLTNEVQTAGWHDVPWDASNLPSGIYFYKLTAGNYSEVRKLVLTK